MGIKERPERIALFIDLDNFVGFCSSLGLPIDLSLEINRLTELGKVTISRSYGDIYKLPISNVQKQELRKMLQNNLIQHEDIPYQNGYKNASDIRLVVDVLSTIYSNEDINLVAVVAADRDFIPLFTELKKIGKEIIGIGGSRDNTPELIVKSCDYFFYHEVLSGRSPSQIEDTVQEPSDITTKETLSDTAFVALSDKDIIKSDSNFTDNENHGEEALKLLIEALKVLETAGNSWNSGSSIISMMRRFKADFDYTAYGYKNFKQLCLRASAENLIEIDNQDGTSYRIHLRETSEINKELLTTSQLKTYQTSENGYKHLKDWYENKIRFRLPNHEQRESVYTKLIAVMKNFAVDEKMQLTALTDRVMEQIKDFNCQQAVCYKLIYSLYRANCFLCIQGPTINNPIVQALKYPSENCNFLDNKLIENALRLYKRDCQVDIDTVAWSEVFFETPEQSERIEEISRTI